MNLNDDKIFKDISDDINKATKDSTTKGTTDKPASSTPPFSQVRTNSAPNNTTLGGQNTPQGLGERKGPIDKKKGIVDESSSEKIMDPKTNNSTTRDIVDNSKNTVSKKDKREKEGSESTKKELKDDKKIDTQKKIRDIKNQAKRVGEEAGAAALQAYGVPKPIGKLAMRQAMKDNEKRFKKIAESKIAQKVKEKADESPTVQSIKEQGGKVLNKATQAYATYRKIQIVQAIINTAPVWGPIVIGILVVFLIMVIIMGIIPGSYGADYKGYSKKDQELLTKISITAKNNPNSDAALALAVIYYPHNDLLFNHETLYLMGHGKDKNEEPISEETIEDYYEDEDDIDRDDSEDKDKEPDINLKVIRKRYKDFEELLPKLTTDEKQNIEYLKSNYFAENKYYERMINRLDSSRGTEDELKDSIIRDILISKQYFYNYVMDAGGICIGSYSESGTVDLDTETIKNLYVQLVGNDCNGGAAISSCTDVEGTKISLKDYVLGVSYAEIGISNTMSIESIKTQIIAAKSFAVGRAKTMGRDYIKEEDDSYLIYMRNGTNDQVYCSIYDGCTKNMVKPAMTQELIDKISIAYDEVLNDYIFDSESNNFTGAYCSSYGECSFCTGPGKCMSQEQAVQGGYEGKNNRELLGYFYSDYELLDITTKKISTSTVSCSGSDQKQYSGEYSGEYPMFPTGTSVHISSPASACRKNPRSGKYQAHPAIDLTGSNIWGTPVTPIREGVIYSAWNDSCGNNMVRIQHTTPSGETYYSFYVHLNKNSYASSLNLIKGSSVTKNTIIGYVGGYRYEDECSTGPHLHFAIEKEPRKGYSTIEALNQIVNETYDFSNIDVISKDCN